MISTSTLRHPTHVAAIGLATAAITLALISQYVFGLHPCVLCLQQRVPYYAGIPVLVLTLWAGMRLPGLLRMSLHILVALAFLWGASIGAQQVAMEWGLLSGPTGCTGGETGASSLMGLSLEALDQARIVPCDLVQGRFLGLSMPGWNVIASLLVALLSLLSAGAGAKWRPVQEPA